MDKIINEFMSDLKNGGCTDIECYEIAIHEFQLAINHLRQEKNKKIRTVYSNLNQISIEDLQ